MFKSIQIIKRYSKFIQRYSKNGFYKKYNSICYLLEYQIDKIDRTFGYVQLFEKRKLKIKNMKIEIWSDIACPFCYIGKRHFEKALTGFADKENIEVEWKSYLLDPDYVYNPENPETEAEYISKRKGISIDEARQMFTSITRMASMAGLTYDFDKVIVANTTDAHKIIQKAKEKNLGDAAEERFFQAFFINGENLNEKDTLVKIAQEIGLTEDEANEALTNDKYAYEVNSDIQEASQIGVRGVPFFVFDRKYGVSGAQPVEAFSQTLEKSFVEWKEKNPKIEMTNIAEGSSCDMDGNCN